jgi:hypothetical protein
MAGNRATTSLVGQRVLARQSGPGVIVPSARRKIVLDANIFDQLSRGNILAAQRLKDLAANHDVYISWQALQEWLVNPKQRAGADTARLIIDELKIKVAPPAPSQVLDELRAKNSFGKGGFKGTILSKAKDFNVAAEAKALGAEVWSFDSTFRNGAVEKTLGVKVADETKTIKGVVGKQNPKTGLRLLKIKEPVIAGQLTAGPAPKPPAPAAPVKPPAHAPTVPAGGSTGKVVKELGEEAVTHAAPKARLGARVAAKIGVQLLDMLVPSPLDALMLMYDFAGSYKAAREEIKRRNLRNGFAIGFAAYLVVPRWEWAKWFAHTVASKDVVTQFLDAVGVAENAFNEGLVRGFIYGEKHSKAQADTVRQKAFNALMAKDRTPGHDDGDDLYTFGRDDVYSFAAVLAPTADAVLAEADRRKAARKQAEEAQKARDDYDAGRNPAGTRFE